MSTRPKSTPEYSLMAFGGSGNIAQIDPFEPALQEALDEGEHLLRAGRPAVEVVRRCVVILENHPRLNAGTGSALNQYGDIEMEAAIMNGTDQSVGAVAGLDRIANPIIVADLIRQDEQIVKLIGQGAFDYATAHGIPAIDNHRLITDRQKASFKKWQIAKGLIIDGEEEKLGTVGAVVRDLYGDLAAATSTGGLTGKLRGRVGDTSTIGAGTYADNFAAVSATGQGEYFVRHRTASRIASLIELSGNTAVQAAQKAMSELADMGGRGGVIVVDKDGVIGSAKTATAKGLAHGALTSEMSATISLEPTEVTGSPAGTSQPPHAE